MPQQRNYLDTPLRYLPTLGEKRATLLESELGLRTYRDLIYYFPFRYVDRTVITPIRELRNIHREVQLKGYLTDYRQEGVGRKQRLKATFKDATGQVELVWFKGSDWLKKRYPEGKCYVLLGQPRLYNGIYSVSHPELTPADSPDLAVGALYGVYNTTEKMKRARLTPSVLGKIIASLLHLIPTYVEETLPSEICAQQHLIPLPDALQQIHVPRSTKELQAAIHRLKFDELFYLQLMLLQTKLERHKRFEGYRFEHVGFTFNSLYDSLPFSLTQAQKRVIREIRLDCNAGHQMNRLLQGDVGSGKTLVAAFSMLLAIDNGYQSCLMAPTEILAAQHYATLSRLLSPIGVEVALLTGSSTPKERRPILEGSADGTLPILVGTHALIEEGVRFAHLGLAVIDEQHRFGVAQRAKLWGKATDVLPHILIMSATPIPRTLAMTLYGDLDISTIDELPPGRKPIVTKHLYEDGISLAYDFIRDRIAEGRQVYVVFPMIEGSEASDYANLETGYKRFVYMFGERNVTWVHGKLPPKDKQERMDAFARNEVPILLSTTVIEVGVDVPNATVMMIENADRFGLSQLHQLRGRVGRGDNQSYCILVTPQALSYTAKRRMEVMTSTTDGFVIAEEDMKLRGAGDIEGTRQSGDLSKLSLAKPTEDVLLMRLAGAVASDVLAADPEAKNPLYAPMWQELERLYPREERWGNIS
jgi:hypothetical protein